MTSAASTPLNEIWTEVRAIIRLAVPIALAQAGFVTMGVVDTAIVGRLGAVPIAAVGLGSGMIFTFTVLGIGVMLGLDPITAQAVGARDLVRARQALWQGIWLALLTAVVVAVPLALVPLALEPLGVAPDIAQQTRLYVWIRMFSIAPVLMFQAARGYLQAHSSMRMLVISVVAANLLNYALNRVCVFGGASVPVVGEALGFIPPMGVRGSALATLVCSVVQFALAAVGVRRIPVEGFSPARRRFDRVLVAQILRVGVPVGLQLGAEVGFFALVGLCAARFGAEEGAAHQIALSLTSISFCMAVGFSEAGSVRVGHCIGAEDERGVRRAGRVAFAVGGTFMAGSGALFLFAPHWLAGAMTDRPEILAVAVPLLAVAAAFQLSDGMQAVGAGVLRGAGDTRFTFKANLIGHYGVGVPVALAAGIWLGKGIQGLWYGLAAGLTAVAAVLVTRFVKLSARPIRPIHPSSPPH